MSDTANTETVTITVDGVEMQAPKGLIVGAVARGERVFVPRGKDRLEAGDVVILFVAEERRHIVGENALTAAPDLVVEILSPSTRQRDETLKRERYARAGVREYWIVDPESRRVAVHVLEGGQLERVAEHAEGEMASAEVLPGFRLALERLFRE